MGKDCGNHGCRRRKIIRGLFACFLVLVFLVLLTILLVWAILRPSKPSFILQDATVYSFNVSSPPSSLTTNLQVTISSRNPNDHIGIYYDRLDVYASYRSQQITLSTHIGPLYQGHKEMNVWTPPLYGNAVPVAPYYIAPLSQDQASGTIQLVIKVNGRLRWKVGTLVTGGYHVHVTCNAYVTFGGRGGAPASTGGSVLVADGLKYQLAQGCAVNV